MAHRTANQQDTDRPTPPAEDGYEVVTADGERKPASLPQRVKEKVRDTLSMTDEQPTWQPGELDDDQTAANGDVTPRENAPTAASQPPQATLVAFRRQHTENIQRVADQTGRWTAQLVTMDQHARARVYDIGRLVALAALGNEAAAQLASDGWANVTPALIGEFAAEVDGWRADRGIA